MDEGSSEPDILEQRVRLRLPRLPSPGWRPSRGASILAAVTLAIGLAAGYAAGHSQARGAAAAAEKPAAPAGQASGGVGAPTRRAGAPPPTIGVGRARKGDPRTQSAERGVGEGG
jgi:hypothetical protein